MFEREQGFTLLEVVVSVAILFLALVPMMDLFSLSTRWADSSRQDLMALALAQGKIEEIKKASFEEVVDAPGDPGAPPVPFPGNPSFSYRLSVQKISRCLKTVSVTVYYETVKGQRELTLTADKSWR